MDCDVLEQASVFIALKESNEGDLLSCKLKFTESEVILLFTVKDIACESGKEFA